MSRIFLGSLVLALGLFALLIQTSVWNEVLEGNSPSYVSNIVPFPFWNSVFLVSLFYFFRKPVWIGLLIGLISGLLLFMLAEITSEHFFSEGNIGLSIEIEQTRDLKPWSQAELDQENFMGTLEKEDCLFKTISSLDRCDTKQCLVTLAGVVGDCMVLSKGEKTNVCANFQALYIEPYCKTSRLLRRECLVLEKTKESHCDLTDAKKESLFEKQNVKETSGGVPLKT